MSELARRDPDQQQPEDDVARGGPHRHASAAAPGWPRLLLLALLLGGAPGCSWMWPDLMPTSSGADDPLFSAGFPFGEGARLDAALCSMRDAQSRRDAGGG